MVNIKKKYIYIYIYIYMVNIHFEKRIACGFQKNGNETKLCSTVMRCRSCMLLGNSGQMHIAIVLWTKY